MTVFVDCLRKLVEALLSELLVSDADINCIMFSVLLLLLTRAVLACFVLQLTSSMAS